MLRTFEEIATDAPLNAEQIEQLTNMVAGLGNYTPEYASLSVDWFCHVLGMGNYYFETTPVNRMAGHLASIMAAEIMTRIRGGDASDLFLVSENPDSAMYVILDEHKVAVDLERRIERKYPACRLQSYRTKGKSGTSHLRMYFVTTPEFEHLEAAQNSDEIQVLGSREFLRWSTPRMLEICSEFYRDSQGIMGPHITLSLKDETEEMRVMVTMHSATNLGFFSAVSDVFNSHGEFSTRKYVEPLANGSRIYIFYLRSQKDAEFWNRLKEDISLAYVVPRSDLSRLFESGELTIEQSGYVFAASVFAHQFLTGYIDEYGQLANALASRPGLLGVLSTLKTRLVKDTFTMSRIREAIFGNVEIVRMLCDDFAGRHKPFDLSGQKPQPPTAAPDPALLEALARDAQNETDQKILRFFLVFNQHVLRTNFYKRGKIALAFRLRPDFLEPAEYPERPFGIFFVLGGEFRGFHVRFRDVARGGIRVVRSSNLQNYLYNANSIFEENYNLALTQQYKNKDIPEGGSKGTVLLSVRHQDKAELSFKKYVDGLLDLLLPSEEIVDHHKQPELLFLGPDEGTADLMRWAALHARSRGYKFWKAFTTGKPPELGGIPHDTHGMTTRGVHAFVLNALNKLGYLESDVTKIQTGGPDGDLGGNEILLSKDRTIGIVDGSGVLFDPAGLDRNELTRLAHKRLMVEHFDAARLGKQGFLVRIQDVNITLPTGEHVPSGVDFRNRFHLHDLARADLFVPCGGRPRAVHINNVAAMLDDKGRPKFKIIVEGANLFLTQEARVYLEERGVVLFKDASANKGGVTSSSLEVLACLALSDDEYAEHLMVQNGRVAVFRQRYIDEVQQFIEHNASLEFECIWREAERQQIPKSVISDQLSRKINRISDAILNSEIWNDQHLRVHVISTACPNSLVELVGIKQIFQRVPNNYLRAMFAAHLASHYVYQTGLDTTEVDFIGFLNRCRAEQAHTAT